MESEKLTKDEVIQKLVKFGRRLLLEKDLEENPDCVTAQCAIESDDNGAYAKLDIICWCKRCNGQC